MEVIYLSGEVQPLHIDSDDRRFIALLESPLDSSLNSGVQNPLNLKGGNGRVINIVTATDKEYDFFVVGRFQRLTHTNRGCLDRSDLLEPDNHSGHVQIFHIVTQRSEGLLGDWGKLCIIVHNATNTTGSENVLSVKDGVVEEKLFVTDDMLNEVALNHVFIPVGVMRICETSNVAIRIAQMILHRETSPNNKEM